MPSTTEYVNKLRESETYRAGIIDDIAEYTLQSKLPLLKSLPPLPKANDDRHVVVIEITGNQPSVYTVLTSRSQSINPSLRSLDKLVFVFVSMKPQLLSIPSVVGGYRLQDGQTVEIDFIMDFHVSDAEKFWAAAKDPIAHLKIKVTDETRKYLMNLNSMHLVESLLEVERSLEQRVIDSQSAHIMQGLENGVRRVAIQGIQLTSVHANITLSKQLKDLQDRIRNTIFGPGGTIDSRHGRNQVTNERREIDNTIDRDPTFAPYSLRDVIRELDMRLLENFYTMSFSDAMSRVHATYETAKREYFERQRNAEIERIEKALATAVRTDMDQMIVDRLKMQLGEKLLESVVNSTVDDRKLRRDFLETGLGIQPTPHLLTGGSAQKALPDS